MWLKELQLAIIEQDTQKMGSLVKDMPRFENLEEMRSASVLIKQALEIITKKREDTALILKKLKKHRDFLLSNAQNQVNKFDITS
jgi:hypothetical protein